LHSGKQNGGLNFSEGEMTVWIYVDTHKQVGDKDHWKVFADQDAARQWFGEHNREGVAFEYPVPE
jgi:hypothetical protein